MFKLCLQSFLRLLAFSSDHRALCSSITNSVVHQQYKSDQINRRKTVNNDRRRVYSSQSLFNSYSERVCSHDLYKNIMRKSIFHS